MSSNAAPALQLEPRFEDGKPLLLAGFCERFTSDTRKSIPALWQRFAPHIGNIPGQVGAVGYGLCSNAVMTPFSFDYMAGVEVSSPSALPGGFTHVRIPALRYAVFPHREHVSKLCNTIDAIYHSWLPHSGHVSADVPRDVPYMFERYGAKFDPHTGLGDMEIWIPIKA